MKVLSAQEIKNLDFDRLQSAAITYAGLASQMAGRLEALEKGYQLLLGKMESDKQQMMFAHQVLKNLQREKYGASSEKRPTATNSPQAGSLQKKKRAKSGRADQPRLPIQEIRHELEAAERQCDACGDELQAWEGQFEQSERIQVIPSRFVLEKHERQKYRCRCGACIKTAPGPVQLKEGSRYSPEFGVQVGIDKYEHHVPLERQTKMMKQAGLEVKSQTLFSQIDTVAWYLKKPVYEKIGERVRSSPVGSADETPWENLGKDAKKSFYLWGVRSKDAVFFQIADSRRSDVAAELLRGFSGILMCDGFRGYNPIASDRLVLAHCWSHARRKFIVAEQAYPKESAEMIALIKRLYDLEEGLKLENASFEKILLTRQMESQDVLERIYKKLWELKSHLPKSSLGKAVDYTLKLWRGLTVFVNYAQVPLDNNAMEREIRGPVTGRKNHLGSKNLKTAEVASVWYTIVASCKTNGIDAKEYTAATLSLILSGKAREVLMPWEWPGPKMATGISGESVSETAGFETLEGLSTKSPGNGPISASKAVS